VVVVYKIDRLTRSLTDFAKIVEVFDAGEVSFVSVIPQRIHPSDFIHYSGELRKAATAPIFRED
jgi:DNA invertase Pin-like site-specific DNA recombinase